MLDTVLFYSKCNIHSLFGMYLRKFTYLKCLFFNYINITGLGTFIHRFMFLETFLIDYFFDKTFFYFICNFLSNLSDLNKFNDPRPKENKNYLI